MKKLPSIKAFLAVITIIFAVLSANQTDSEKNSSKTLVFTHEYILASKINLEKFPNKNEDSQILPVKEEDTKVEEPEPIVYDGMTLNELANKLNKVLKSTLTGYGLVFAEYSLQYEVDPYLSVAIVLHETGCNSGKCSTLARKCNNIGGMKGSPGCGGGSYKKFKTLDEGIEAFYKNLAKNYYQKGLTTPEKIGKKYAESSTWPERIKFYINKIKNS